MTAPRSLAFTLIELLVVIAILAVLIGLLTPAASKALASSEAARCASNLRQIGVGLLAYAGEHDGCFPLAGAVVARGGVDSATQQPGWTEQIEPYMGTDLRVYRCQSCANLQPASEVYSYFLGARAAYEAADGAFSALRLQRIANPSRYILGGDITAGTFSRDDADKDDYTTDCAFGGDVSRLHRGMANILFADGSVGAFKAYDPGLMEISYTNPDATY